MRTENILCAHGKSKPKPPCDQAQTQSAQGVPQEVLLGGERADGEGDPQNPQAVGSEMETASLPPSGDGHGGEESLGDVQTGPCVVWSIQPVEPAVKRGRPTGCHLFLDVGMIAQSNFSGAKKEYEVGNPTGQGDELYGNQQFASPKVVSWGAEREGDVKGEYGVVYEDAPVDEGYAVVEVGAVREDEEGLGIPDCYLSGRCDPVGQQVRGQEEQHAEHRPG